MIKCNFRPTINLSFKVNQSFGSCNQKNNISEHKNISEQELLNNENYGRTILLLQNENKKEQLCSDDFLKKYKHHYQNKPLLKTISEVVKNPKCYINEGTRNATYIIPKIDDYIIRIPKRFKTEFPVESLGEIVAIDDDYPQLNVGQPIMQNKQKMQICKKQNGLPVSGCDWGMLKANRNVLNHDLAVKFLLDLEKLSSFPLESYKELVVTLKQIDKHLIDFLNSNNFLIDTKNQKINRVDITDDPAANVENYSKEYSKEDVIYALINVLIHSYVRDELNDEEKVRLEKATKEIIQKCNMASDSQGIKYRYDYPSEYWKKATLGYTGEELYKEFESDINRTQNIYVENIYDNARTI